MALFWNMWRYFRYISLNVAVLIGTVFAVTRERVIYISRGRHAPPAPPGERSTSGA